LTKNSVREPDTITVIPPFPGIIRLRNGRVVQENNRLGIYSGDILIWSFIPVLLIDPEESLCVTSGEAQQGLSWLLESLIPF